MKLTIHHLYADMMNLYGDRGNVISIKKRLRYDTRLKEGTMKLTVHHEA